MGLESATYISDLVATNPTASDGKSQGDDHLRLLKSTIKATFSAVTGEVTASHTELNYLDAPSNLASIAVLADAGVIVRTGTNAIAARSIVAGAGCVVTNGDGVSGDIEIALSPSVGAGDVLGPASATDGAIAVFDGTSGKSIKVMPSGPSSTLVGISDTQTLTNKTISGASNTISGVSLTTGVTGTLPVANGGTGATTLTGIVKADGTSAFAAATAGTDYAKPNTSSTWTAAQTFSRGVFTGKTTSVANNLDLSLGNVFTHTLSGNTSFTVSNVPATGTTATVILDLTNGGAHTITWWSGVKWSGGVAPTLTASGRDMLGFITHDGGTTWSGFLMGLDLK